MAVDAEGAVAGVADAYELSAGVAAERSAEGTAAVVTGSVSAEVAPAKGESTASVASEQSVSSESASAVDKAAAPDTPGGGGR